MASEFDILNPGQNTWEAARVGVDAPFLQRGRYYTPADGGSPIRTVIPPSERQVLTTDQQLKLRAIETDDLEKKVRMKGALLNQRLALADEQFKANSMDQAEELIRELPKLRPGDTDYIQKRSELFSKYPLGSQTAAVLRMTETLDSTHQHVVTNKDILNRQIQINEDERQQREIEQARGIAAKFGALSQFEELRQGNPKESPLSIISKMADAQEEQDTIASLKRMGIKENQFYTPEVGLNGQPTGRSRFDVKAAKVALENIPSEKNALSAIHDQTKLSEKYGTLPFEKWDVDDQVSWNILANTVRRYGKATGQNLGGEEETAKPVGTRPNSPNADLLFGPKPSPRPSVTPAPNK